MRIFLVVLDSVGIGALPDAHLYGDEGSNTLGNIAEQVDLELPHLAKLGLGNITEISGVPPVERPQANFGRMAEAAPGKDTITGHWEMAGVIIDTPFHTYPHGFPEPLIAEFTRRIGRKVLGNFAASGTEIINELGEKHFETGYPIVYTSADSVFQIAAHEDVIPLADLYGMCAVARELCTGEYNVARIIARPFVGQPGSFSRTANRRDFSLRPPRPTVLEQLVASGREVLGVGKIKDIFAGQGITENFKTRDNAHGLETIEKLVARGDGDFIFANLVDFDSAFGHRNDVQGYARALIEADRGLGEIIPLLTADDILIITADHGCDPTFPGSDHTREYVPLLVYGATLKSGIDLGTRPSFADVAATVADLLAVEYQGDGNSFAGQILREVRE